MERCKLHEECGVFGIYSNDNIDVAGSAYYALYALQHRGQESCGIAVCDDGIIRGYTDNGLVNDVFTSNVLSELGGGQMAVGHVRYGTDKDHSRGSSQPIIITHIKGNMALCNNGSLTNYAELREELEMNGVIFRSVGDAEVIASVIVGERLKSCSIEDAVCEAMYRLKGAYSTVIMSPTKLMGMRDPYGYHPLCIGKLENSYILTSETCALDSIGATFVRDVEPGELVVIDKDGIRSIKTHCGTKPQSLCVFEFVYFARPDSVIDGSSVHEARMRAGAFLAKQEKIDADMVIGVPDSGIDAAIGYAQESGIPYGLGFLKNKYIGRTFIQPTQADRENKVRIKLNPIATTVAGKRVVMVDDSIVRGTTCARIVRLLRNAGAKEVHVRVTAPPFKYPCYFGTDVPEPNALIANRFGNNADLAKELGADSVGFITVENVAKIAKDCNLKFCTGCFTGEYACEPPVKAKKNKYSKKISEGEKN
ncbi:MAG: amidophosphoribosyltransferase [Clostridia bacterium]|nr:amidophosphoribosyltransferase [Clostridia bacterium]